MRNFYPSVIVLLFYIWQSVVALNCDPNLVSNAGIVATNATSTYLQSGSTVQIQNAADGCPTSFVTSTNICRVTMHIATSNKSSIYMEVWMPDDWQGRYISTGNFGLNGCVIYDDLTYLTSLGLAAGGADGGHAGGSGQYFAHNLEIIKDFSYRSVHTLTVNAKQVTKFYYNFTPNKSYYYGCSTGGRQGLQSAQMFPEDFDGIVAGSAAADSNNLNGWAASFFIITGPSGSPTFLSTTQWRAVHAAIMAKCDSIDGVSDGIIEDPDLCTFDAQTLSCGMGQNSDLTKCLTATQAETVTKVLGPLRTKQGKLLFPAMQLGVEDQDAGGFYGGHPFPIPTNWYQYAIFPDKKFDPSKLSLHDILYADQLDLGSISTWSGNLSTFESRGGKLLTTHGLADPIITSTNSARYYRHVSATMNLPPTSLDNFYRYFRISGMGHCGGGEGAWEIGQTGSDVPNTAQNNVLFALFDWVEKEAAPDTLLGTKYNGGPDIRSTGVKFQRNHCRYPFRTTFVGGDPTKPESWDCQAIVDPSQVMAEET